MKFTLMEKGVLEATQPPKGVLEKSLLWDTRDMVPEDSIGVDLQQFIRRMKLLALDPVHKSVTIAFKFPDNEATGQDNNMITVSINSSFLAELQILLHQGDVDQTLQLSCTATLFPDGPSVKLASLQPTSSSTGQNGERFFHHIQYKSSMMFPPHFFQSVQPTEGSDSTWKVEIKLELDVDQRDYARLNGILPLIMYVQRRLQTDAESCDMTLVAKDGEIFRCHKAFMMQLGAVVRNEILEHGRIQLDITKKGAEALLDFVYTHSFTRLKRESKVTFELYRTAVKNQMYLLKSALEMLIGGRGQDWFDLDETLYFYLFLKENKETRLQKKILRIISMYGNRLLESVLITDEKFDKKVCMELLATSLNK